jgi:hypothetical protein
MKAEKLISIALKKKTDPAKVVKEVQKAEKLT